MRTSQEADERVERGIAFMLCALATNAPPDGVTNAEASAMAAARTAVVASVLDETIFPQKMLADGQTLGTAHTWPSEAGPFFQLISSTI